MKIISNTPKNRVVELEGNERRVNDYADLLLDEGWDLYTALKYACKRYGTVTPMFRLWFLTGLPA